MPTMRFLAENSYCFSSSLLLLLWSTVYSVSAQNINNTNGENWDNKKLVKIALMLLFLLFFWYIFFLLFFVHTFDGFCVTIFADEIKLWLLAYFIRFSSIHRLVDGYYRLLCARDGVIAFTGIYIYGCVLLHAIHKYMQCTFSA